MSTTVKDKTDAARRLYAINAALSGSLEPLTDGRWLARHSGLNLYAYGDTGDEAIERIRESIELLITSHMKRGGPKALNARFARAGLEVDVLEVKHRKPETGHKQTFATLLSMSTLLEYSG